jgi:hypothetical protein
MCASGHESGDVQRRRFLVLLLVMALSVLFTGQLRAQSASAGALTGVTLDPSGAAIPGVNVQIIRRDSAITLSATSDDQGRFGFQLLTPGSYELQAVKPAFDPLQLDDIDISVTETLRIELRLHLATVAGHVEVSSGATMVQTEDSALGRVVNGTAVTGLPLATRNFAQIAALSPGVASGVFNAAELGPGGIALSQINNSNDGIFVHGARSYNNDSQLDGVDVSDVQSTGAASGGIPIPNPDAIEEFKVQTALYDAAYGRFGGGSISLVTKSGGNSFHGSFFEFFRNSVLNANEFFLKEAGQPRPSLQQNQFGFAAGGPVHKDKLYFFGSYQGTRQTNGLAAGQNRIACTATLRTPPLTDDRTPAALGKLFGGMSGALGGVAVRPDGSNINPVALALLNFKLPDGAYLIPTPQMVDSTQPFASQGFSAFTEACHFNEDQFVTNIDYVASPRSTISGRFFFADDNQLVAFPGNGLNPEGNISGFPSPGDSGFRVFSFAHTYTFSSAWLNEARFGYVRTRVGTRAETPFSWSDVGVSEGPMSDANALPSLNILGSVSIAPGFPRTYTQNSFIINDTLSFVHGAHSFQLGGSLTRLQDNLDVAGLGSFLQFLSWPDFLLGLDAVENGTGTFSNVFASVDVFGLLNREYRVWEGAAFAQDDYKVTRSLTLNMGIRYERLGQFGDKLGRNSSFAATQADPNPPAGGSLAGYIVASNFPGTPPAGVLRAANTFGDYGANPNTIAPRFGFAWQILPDTGRLVLRGGYGMYYSRPTGQVFSQSVVSAPFALPRLNVGMANAGATFADPFQQPFPTPSSFPLFVPYGIGTSSTLNTVAPGFRPALIQQFGLNLQGELYPGWLLEVGYVGTEGSHLQRFRSLNQAMQATPDNPIRGVTSDTLANIPLRVPVPGIAPDSLDEVETEGRSWYSGLEVSLTKRISHGLQFLASYTFSKTLDTDGADIDSNSAGNSITLGDQNSPSQRWGRASFDRAQRFVFSSTWTLPSPAGGIRRAVLGNWSVAAVATIQSGTALTIADTNSNNVFGINEDRAQLTGYCTKNQLVMAGSVESKLNGYFNASCFTTPPVIGADGIGTAFGDSATGLVTGPGQANLDLALSKTQTLAWFHERTDLEFRAEFFNAFNHPQFANPDSNFSSPTFGVISSTSVSARISQLALKFSF